MLASRFSPYSSFTTALSFAHAAVRFLLDRSSAASVGFVRLFQCDETRALRGALSMWVVLRL